MAHSSARRPADELTTPDAIHLATAIAIGCDRFFTFDGQDPKEKRGRKLLPLGPTIAGQYSLATVLPRRPVQAQAKLPFLPKKATTETT